VTSSCITINVGVIESRAIARNYLYQGCAGALPAHTGQMN